MGTHDLPKKRREKGHDDAVPKGAALCQGSVDTEVHFELIVPDKPSMAKQFFVDRAIDDATFILERVDSRWPSSEIARSAGQG